jgi:hypothetical protein
MDNLFLEFLLPKIKWGVEYCKPALTSLQPLFSQPEAMDLDCLYIQ